MGDVIFDAKHPRARKTHTCSQCRRQIQPGETYRRQNYIYDGYPGTVAHCSQCAWFSDKLFTVGFENDDGGWPFLYELESGEVAYCGFGAEHRLYRNKWRKTDDTLITVPELEAKGEPR